MRHQLHIPGQGVMLLSPSLESKPSSFVSSSPSGSSYFINLYFQLEENQMFSELLFSFLEAMMFRSKISQQRLPIEGALFSHRKRSVGLYPRTGVLA